MSHSLSLGLSVCLSVCLSVIFFFLFLSLSLSLPDSLFRHAVSEASLFNDRLSEQGWARMGRTLHARGRCAFGGFQGLGAPTRAERSSALSGIEAVVVPQLSSGLKESRGHGQIGVAGEGA